MEEERQRAELRDIFEQRKMNARLQSVDNSNFLGRYTVHKSGKKEDE